MTSRHSGEISPRQSVLARPRNWRLVTDAARVATRDDRGVTPLSFFLAALFVLRLAAPAGAAVSTNQSGWLWALPEPQGYTLFAFEFHGSTGYAAGEFGTLLRTNDGGSSWTTVRTGESIDFLEIDVIDADSVVVASECAVRRTDDGGRTFRRLPFAASSERGCSRRVVSVSFSFPTADVGYLLTTDGAVLRTTDGGRSFSSRAVPQGGGLTALMFRNATEGLATTTGGDIFRTTDGGSSWSREFDGDVALNGGRFIGAQAVAVGAGGRFLVSSDGGDTWTRPAAEPGAPTPPFTDFVDVRCASATTCLVVPLFGPGGLVYRTTDGGRSFDSTGVSNAFALDYASATRAVTVGFGGETHVSDDGGARFARLGDPLPAPLSGRLIRATSTNVAHLAGAHGVLMRTLDGGETWANVSVPTDASLRDVWFATTDVGYAIDISGGFFGTENGGASWSILDTGVDASPKGVFAPDTSSVYLIGPRGVLRSNDGGGSFERHPHRVIRNRTLVGADEAGSSVVFFGPRVIALSNNDGATWRKIKRPTRRAVEHVDFVSARVGYALQADGRVYFTRNRGRRWSELTGTGYDNANRLAFGDRRNGWLSLDSPFRDDARPNVLRTTDGGKSWKPQILARYSINGIAAAGSKVGFAASPTPGILFTRNGGEAGAQSALRLSTADRRVPRGTKVKIRGRLAPAEGGEDVEVRVRRLTGRRWREIDVAPNRAGRFTIKRRIRRPTVFVAQWAGDPNSDGDGSRPLIVRVGR